MDQPQVSDNRTEVRSYVDADSGFTLNVPKGWLVDNSGQQASKLVLFQPTGTGTGIAGTGLTPMHDVRRRV